MNLAGLSTESGISPLPATAHVQWLLAVPTWRSHPLLAPPASAPGLLQPCPTRTEATPHSIRSGFIGSSSAYNPDLEGHSRLEAITNRTLERQKPLERPRAATALCRGNTTQSGRLEAGGQIQGLRPSWITSRAMDVSFVEWGSQ